MGRQLGGDIDGSGAVCATDNADGSGIRQGKLHAQKVQRQRPEQSGKDAKLRRRAQQQGARVGQQRTKIRHRPHAHEDQQWENTGGQAHGINQIENTVAVIGVYCQIMQLVLYRWPCRLRGRIKRVTPCPGLHTQHLRHGGQQVYRAKMQRLTDGGFRQPGHGNIGQQATKADGQQQQWLELFVNGQPQQAQADQQHDQLAATHVKQPGAVPEGLQLIHWRAPR